MNIENILQIQTFNQQIYADETIKTYVSEIVDATRNPVSYGIHVADYIEYGASPRASLWLILTGKAHAMMQGRGFVKPEDIQAVAYETLRHRILLTYEAEAEEISSDEIISQILNSVKIP
jgi:MoxR-like ATPase